MNQFKRLLLNPSKRISLIGISSDLSSTSLFKLSTVHWSSTYDCQVNLHRQKYQFQDDEDSSMKAYIGKLVHSFLFDKPDRSTLPISYIQSRQDGGLQSNPLALLMLLLHQSSSKFTSSYAVDSIHCCSPDL